MSDQSREAELPGQDILEQWKLRNFSPAFDHAAAMKYREETRDDFKRQADLVLDSILKPLTGK